MRIVRSTINESDILETLKENYLVIQPYATCLFEYRGLNDIYQFICGKYSYFFKIFAREDIDQKAIEAEVEITNHLKKSGLSVAYSIPQRNGNYLLPINTPERTKFGVMYSAAEGVPIQYDMMDEKETLKIGNLISNLHTILVTISTPLQRWRLDEGLFLDHSIKLLEEYSLVNPKIDLPFLQQVVKELRDRIQTNSNKWNWGLCHGDIYTGNIHRSNDGNLTLFDFDFCGYGWRAYDASPLLGRFSAGISPEMNENRKKLLDYFLRGYDHAGGFSNLEIEAIYKIFVPFRRIFNMGYLYHAFSYVWGNKLRNEQIINDTRLLHDWVDYYW